MGQDNNYGSIILFLFFDSTTMDPWEHQFCISINSKFFYSTDRYHYELIIMIIIDKLPFPARLGEPLIMITVSSPTDGSPRHATVSLLSFHLPPSYLHLAALHNNQNPQPIPFFTNIYVPFKISLFPCSSIHNLNSSSSRRFLLLLFLLSFCYYSL